MTNNNGNIFVSIASYRDNVCIDTLESLYSNARFPTKIYVGICQQNDPNDPTDKDCLSDANLNDFYKSNVSIIRIPHTDAKGPTYARYLCSTLWKNEEFFMQIDSHTKFVKDWDIKCIGMLNKIKQTGLSQKPVLSHYPKEIGEFINYTEASDNKSIAETVPRICKSFFNERGMLSFMGAEQINTNGELYNTPYVAGGMIFTEAYFLKELPFDPNLPYLFVGEEIIFSIRFFTNGWDVFTPSENIVFHEYTRSDKPKIWTDNPYYSDISAFNKILVYLKLNCEKDSDAELCSKTPNDIHTDGNPLYGLGNKRSLQDFYDFTKIDVDNKRVRSNFCRQDNIASETDIDESCFLKKDNTFLLVGGHKQISLYFHLFLYFILMCCIILIAAFSVPTEIPKTWN